MPGPIICAAALMVRPRTAVTAIGTRRIAIIPAPSAPLFKVRDTSQHPPTRTLRSTRGTAEYLILVPLIDLKFLNELAAGDAGTSNRRHSARGSVFWVPQRVEVKPLSRPNPATTRQTTRIAEEFVLADRRGL